MANVVGFSARDAARVARVTRRVEAMPNGLTTSAMIGAAAMVRNVQFVRVTSSAGFTISGIKYLEAIVQTWSVADGGFEDLTDDPSCYLFQISNADLTTDGSAVYEAVQMAAYDFGDGILPVFGTQWQPLVLDVICNASDNIEITTTV